MFDVIGKRNWFFLFSGLILVPGLIFIALTPITDGKQGLQFSVDYTEGTKWTIQFKNKDVAVADVERVLVANGITDATVAQDADHYFTIRTKRIDLFPPQTPPPVKTASAEASGSAGASESAAASATASPSPSPVASAATESPAASPTASASASPAASGSPAASASPTLPPNLIASTDQNGHYCDKQIAPPGSLIEKLEKAFVADSAIGPIACTAEQSTVGPTISAELIQQTILLIILGSLGILTWIGIRFHSVKFGATAVVALVHDVIVVVGIFAILGTLFGVQIDALFVTAMLTVIGFSVHDTIVVYDRIRENKARHAGEPFDQIVNHSILQTFGRSINTSFTVVLTLTALLLFAGASIKYFVLALLIGIISGTYSSIFNASPLLVVWQLHDDRRRAERIALARGRRSGY